MKTAISFPDALFRSADALGRHLGLSRSRLFAKALEFIANYRAGKVAERLNEVYANTTSKIGPQLTRAQKHVSSRGEW